MPETGARPIPPLHLVTDDGVLRARDFMGRAEEALDAGGARVALHLRGPTAGGAELHALARRLLPVARAAGSILLVNDRVDVAAACGADGVQLGRRSLRAPDARRILGPAPLIGVSVHPGEESEAGGDGADFLLAGTLYPTPSHPDGEASGTAWLPGLAALGRPVVGIGGITPARVAGVLAAGVVGVAVVRGVWAAGRTGVAVEDYLEMLEGKHGA